jgi:hypothetical protein
MKYVNIAVVIAASVMASPGATAEEITTCREPSGTAYFHYSGLVDKKGSGWQSDKIGGGAVTLVQNSDLSFDILYLDTRKKPISSVQDGGIVRLLRQSGDALTLLVHYAGATTEIYSFFREKDGQSRFTMMQSKTGAGAVVPKSSILLGLCETIRFDLVRGK